MGDQAAAMSLPTQDNINPESSQPIMSRMGFEPTNPVFEPIITVHALNRTATVVPFGIS
jgi:hypothetical protein